MYLLALSNIQMSLLALILLPFVWTGNGMFSLTFLMFAAGTAVLTSGGQISLFFTLKQSKPSQVIPLLAFKILVLAFANIVISGQALSLLQWVSVFLCVGATFVLHFSGEPIPLRDVFGILTACTAYASSDICISLQLQQLTLEGFPHPTLLGTCVTYLINGGVGALILLMIRQKGIKRRDWTVSGYFALAWFLSMLFLFNTFRLVGPVFGNVLQSTRAMFSILLAKLLGMRGVKELEHDMSAAVLIRRLLAAVLFSCAIGLYVIGE